MLKNICRVVGYGFLAVALTVPLAACDTSDAGSPSAEVDDTGTGGSPEVEGTGPENPRSPDGGKSVSYPDLPVGRDSQTDRCLTVQWLGHTDVPDGVSVQVKGVRFEPGGVFEQHGRGCDGAGACTGSFAFTSAGNSCSVGLVATAKEGKTGYLVLTGVCVPRGRPQCRELLAQGGKRIELTQPTDERSDEESPPDDDSPPEQGPSSADQPPAEENPPPDESPPTTTG